MSVKITTGDKPMETLFVRDGTNLVSPGFWLNSPITVIGTGLGEDDIITFKVVYLKGAEKPTSDCACLPVFFNKPSVIGEEFLVCPECVDEVGFVPVRLTANNPVVVLDSPLGQVLQAVYDGDGRPDAHVWIYQGANTASITSEMRGCPKECCEDLVWYDTGEFRCNIETDTKEIQQVSNCGRIQWVEAGYLTWENTNETRCNINQNIQEIQQVNNCGDLRWVEGPELTWTPTGLIECNLELDILFTQEVNNCGGLRWVESGPLLWTPTGEFRCNVDTDKRDIQEQNPCGETRWVESEVDLTWSDTGNYQCDLSSDTQQKEQRNNCGDLRWVDDGPIVWTPTGETRCENQTVKNEEVNYCGGTRWVATEERCGFTASFPVPGSCGWAYQEGDNIDPDATVELQDCDGEGLGIWLYPSPRALPLATIPVYDCAGANCPPSGEVLGYARNNGPDEVERCDLVQNVNITGVKPWVVAARRDIRNIYYIWSDGTETVKYEPRYCASLPIEDGFGYRSGDLTDPEATELRKTTEGVFYRIYPTPRPGATIPHKGGYLVNTSYCYAKAVSSGGGGSTFTLDTLEQDAFGEEITYSNSTPLISGE